MISSVSDLLAGTLHGVKGEAVSRFFSRRWYLNLIGLLLGLLVLGGILGAIAVPVLWFLNQHAGDTGHAHSLGSDYWVLVKYLLLGLGWLALLTAVLEGRRWLGGAPGRLLKRARSSQGAPASTGPIHRPGQPGSTARATESTAAERRRREPKTIAFWIAAVFLGTLSLSWLLNQQWVFAVLGWTGTLELVLLARESSSDEVP